MEDHEIRALRIPEIKNRVPANFDLLAKSVTKPKLREEERRRLEQHYTDEYEVETYRKKREIDMEYHQKIFSLKENLLKIQQQMREEQSRSHLQSLQSQAEFYEQQLNRMNDLLD